MNGIQAHRGAAIALSALALITLVLTGCQASRQPAASSPSSRPSQVELPFTGLNSPTELAVDGVGDVYVTDEVNNRVLKLPAGSNTQVELPFTRPTYLGGPAVDTADNVYITDGP